MTTASPNLNPNLDRDLNRNLGRDQERLSRLQARHDSVKHLTEADAFAQFNKANTVLAQLTLFDLLNRFDFVTLSKRLKQKPELFLPLVNAFCNFSRLCLAREKFEWQKKQAEAKQRARDQKQRARTPILITADTVRSLRTHLQPSPTPQRACPRPQPSPTVTADTAQPPLILRWPVVGQLPSLRTSPSPIAVVPFPEYWRSDRVPLAPTACPEAWPDACEKRSAALLIASPS